MPAGHCPQFGCDPIAEVAADVGNVLAKLARPLIHGNPLDCENKIGKPSFTPVVHARSHVTFLHLPA